MNLQQTQYQRPLILDLGYNTFRLGWSGSDEPEILSPSIYAHCTDFIFHSEMIEGLTKIVAESQENPYLFGKKAKKYLNILNLQPIKAQDRISLLKEFFLEQYKRLEIPSEYQFNQSIIIICPYNLSDLEKNQFKELFFTQLNFPFILFLPSDKAILSTLNTVDGVIVDIGAENTYVSSIFHGFINPMAKETLPIGGFHLTKYLLDLIVKKKGTDKNFFFDIWMAKEIKEKMALCVLNPKEEMDKIKNGLTKYDKKIKLPNQNQFTINSERFQLVEPLFNPQLIHLDYEGLTSSIIKSIKFWERDHWPQLISNIILAGGTSKIPGLKKRLIMEMRDYFSENLGKKIRVIAPEDREIMAWIGASLLSAQGKLEKWIKNPASEQ